MTQRSNVELFRDNLWLVHMNRRLVCLSITGVLALSLSSCTKPKPAVTVTAGTSSAHTQAICWSLEAALSAITCSEALLSKEVSSPDIAKVKVAGDQTIGISVDPKVAEFGWYAIVNGQRLNKSAVTSTYYHFTSPFTDIPANGYDLQIISQSQQTGARGLWLFKLVGN